MEAMIQQVKNIVEKRGFNIKPPTVYTGNRPDLYTGAANLNVYTAANAWSPNNDGSYLQWSTNTAAYILYGADGVADWSVLPTNINASATGWIHGFHWDTVDNLIYVAASNASGDIYFGSINPTTGATVQIGATILATGLTTTSNEYQTGVCRVSNGSGNLFIIEGANILELTVTGTLVRAFTKGSNTGSYRTADGYYVHVSAISSIDGESYITMYTENTTLANINIPVGVGFATQSNCTFSQIGDYVTFREASGGVYGAKYFDKVDFDRFIRELYEAWQGV